MGAKTESEFVLRALDGDGVLLVTLNRPEKKNAFHEAQWDALADCLNEAREDPAVAVVVLTGAGGNFSSGVDLSSFGGEPAPPRRDGKASAFFALVDALFGFDKPLLAAVQGVAVGGDRRLVLVRGRPEKTNVRVATHADEVAHGKTRRQLVDLRDDRRTTRPLSCGEVTNGAPVKQNRAETRAYVPGYRVQQRRLSGAVGPQQGDQLTVAHTQIDPGQDRPIRRADV